MCANGKVFIPSSDIFSPNCLNWRLAFPNSINKSDIYSCQQSSGHSTHGCLGFSSSFSVFWDNWAKISPQPASFPSGNILCHFTKLKVKRDVSKSKWMNSFNELLSSHFAWSLGNLTPARTRTHPNAHMTHSSTISCLTILLPVLPPRSFTSAPNSYLSSGT